MKTIKETTLVVALMLGTLSSYAVSNVETAPKAFSNELTEEVRKGHLLAIKDNAGHTIYSETVNSNGNFNTSFDLSQLKDGLYTLELSKDFEIKTTQFVVTAKEVTYLKNTEKSVYKPVFRMENSKVLISQLALDKESTLEIKIYFENELIHQEEISGNAILNRVYNLKEKTPGHYKVVMKANGRTYKRNFKI
ncbi:MAG: hypothetical protein AAGH46_04615 [Bacteroidota bacterium]